MRNLVVLNEQHSLLEDQKRILQAQFEKFEIFSVPANGWTIEEMKEEVTRILSFSSKGDVNVVFASPVPVLMAMLSFWSGYGSCGEEEFSTPIVGKNVTCYIMHNDHREKKELPNGKIIMTVAQKGWQLVKITY